MEKKKQKSKIRYFVLAFFFVLIAAISVNHALTEKGIGIKFLSTASLHALCPFGGVVSIYQFVTSGTFVKKTHESSFILMFIVIGLSILFGALFCGWVCPFGAFQEFSGKLGKKIFKKKFNNIIPAKIDNYLRYIRYIVLAMIIYNTARLGKLAFADIDPYYALFKFWTSEVTIASIVILLSVTALSFFIERPFCKYACPYGAFLGLFNFIRIFSIKRNAATCIDCKACDRACPMNIIVSTSKKIYNHQCISCMKCASEEACPVDQTVLLKAGAMEVKK